MEFRAPSRLVGDRLVEGHEDLAAGMAEMFAGGCLAGRRALRDAEAAAGGAHRALRRLSAEALAARALEAGRAERQAETIAAQAAAIAEQERTIAAQAATIARLEAAAASSAAVAATAVRKRVTGVFQYRLDPKVCAGHGTQVRERHVDVAAIDAKAVFCRVPVRGRRRCVRTESFKLSEQSTLRFIDLYIDLYREIHWSGK